MGCDSLYLPVSLPNLRERSLPFDLTSRVYLRRVTDFFLFVLLFSRYDGVMRSQDPYLLVTGFVQEP